MMMFSKKRATAKSGPELLEPADHSASAAADQVYDWMGDNTNLDLESKGGIAGLVRRAQERLDQGDFALAFALSIEAFNWLCVKSGVDSWDPAAVQLVTESLQALRDNGDWTEPRITPQLEFVYDSVASLHPASVFSPSDLAEYSDLVIRFYALAAERQIKTGDDRADNRGSWQSVLQTRCEFRANEQPGWEPPAEVAHLL